MKETRIKQLEQTNREQREEIERLNKIIKQQQQENLTVKISCYNAFAEITNVGHSNNINKVIKMTDVSDKMVNDLFEDIKIELYVENDEKILELPKPAKVR